MEHPIVISVREEHGCTALSVHNALFVAVEKSANSLQCNCIGALWRSPARVWAPGSERPFARDVTWTSQIKVEWSSWRGEWI